MRLSLHAQHSVSRTFGADVCTCAAVFCSRDSEKQKGARQHRCHHTPVVIVQRNQAAKTRSRTISIVSYSVLPFLSSLEDYVEPFFVGMGGAL